MAYQKKYQTREERSRAFSEFGKKGVAARKAIGYSNVGRRKGSPETNPVASIPAKTICVHEADREVFRRLAAIQDLSVVEFMHHLAEALKTRNTQLFSKEV